MTTGKTIALTRQTFVGKVMSLLFNMLSRLFIAFLPRNKHLLILCLIRRRYKVDILRREGPFMRTDMRVFCPYSLVYHLSHPEMWWRGQVFTSAENRQANHSSLKPPNASCFPRHVCHSGWDLSACTCSLVGKCDRSGRLLPVCRRLGWRVHHCA